MILAYKGVDFRYAFFIVSIWISKCLELHTCILFKHITKVSTASKHPIRNIFIFLHLLKKMELRSMCVLYHELKKTLYFSWNMCVRVFFCQALHLYFFPKPKTTLLDFALCVLETGSHCARIYTSRIIN
jgi:hypothetical protein